MYAGKPRKETSFSVILTKDNTTYDYSGKPNSIYQIGVQAYTCAGPGNIFWYPKNCITDFEGSVFAYFTYFILPNICLNVATIVIDAANSMTNILTIYVYSDRFFSSSWNCRKRLGSMNFIQILQQFLAIYKHAKWQIISYYFFSF